LVGLGADFDVLPELRVSLNANYLAFAQTEILEVARQQGDIGRGIGFDLSASAIYRPKFTQNFVFRGSVASLEPTGGFAQIFDNNRGRSRYLSVLLNATVSY
jgi:hypothetical protein